MADPDRDTVYRDGTGTNRTIYTRESNSTGWFVGIIVALALLAIAYLVFSANSQPASTSVDVNNTPAVTTPAPADTNTTPLAPANDNTMTTTPATQAPTAPASTAPTAPSAAPSAPASDVTAPSAAPSAAVSSAPVAASSAAQ